MSTRTKTVVAVVLVAVVALGAGLYWYLGDDAPEEVSLDRAIESVTPTDPARPADAEGGSDGTAEAGLEGTWTLDAESGDFDYESATGSFVGFRIQEELVGVGAAEAVGRTGGLTGSLTIEGTTLTATTIEADMAAITTNEPRRDSRAHEAMGTAQFPTATFTLTAPAELGPLAETGERIEVTVEGQLTVHGVTQPVSLPIQAQLVDGTIVAVGSMEIAFADYGVSVPSAPIVVSAEDHGVVELQVLFTRG